MRPALALVFGAVFTMGAIGCTFLVNFEDAPDAGFAPDDDDDGTSSGRVRDSGRGTSSSSGDDGTSSSSGGTSSSSSSSSSSSGGAAYPPACDTANLGAANCAGKANGMYCGIANAADDLTECENGNAVCIYHCTMGCAVLNGADDQCADCKDKASPERWYCGKDANWEGAARSYAYACSNGKVVNGPAPSGNSSPGGCGLNLCHSTCTRTSPPPLNGACCQNTPEP